MALISTYKCRTLFLLYILLHNYYISGLIYNNANYTPFILRSGPEAVLNRSKLDRHKFVHTANTLPPTTTQGACKAILLPW